MMPFLHGFLQGGVQAVDITRVDQDGIHVLGHQVLQLLDLAGHIGVGAFDHQFIGDAASMYSLFTSCSSSIICVRYSLLMNGFEMPMVNFLSALQVPAVACGRLW